MMSEFKIGTRVKLKSGPYSGKEAILQDIFSSMVQPQYFANIYDGVDKIAEDVIINAGDIEGEI
jgi:hypothetical protein